MANNMVEGLEEAYGELRSALVLLGMVSVAAGHWQQDVNHSESTECKMVKDALKASRAIEPGMSGRELEEHWRGDGGASVRDAKRMAKLTL